MPPGHRGLVAWQRGMDLAVAIYSLNRGLRKARHGELASQLVRAVLAVPSNIAEGRVAERFTASSKRSSRKPTIDLSPSAEGRALSAERRAPRRFSLRVERY